MLKSLSIVNYAIIDELSIEFSRDLNVITGETGAGKSILMGALSLILGDRADTSVLLNREKKCIVEGVFVTLENLKLQQLLKAFDVEDESANEEFVIRREIAASGKSRAFINDSPVNLEQLRAISSLLVDLHRQFDTLSLSDADFQREVIDALAGNSKLLTQYQEVYRNWRTTQDMLSSLSEKKLVFNKEYDYNKFLFDELEEANLQENELENADNELKMLSNAESIKQALEQASHALSGGEQPLVQQLRSVQHQLSNFARYHPSLEELLRRLASAQIEIQDIAGEVETLSEDISHDPRRIAILNERIAAGYKLLKKHGVQTTADLLLIRQSLEEKLQGVMDIEELLLTKEKEVLQLQEQAKSLAAGITKVREKQVRPLEERVNKLLVQVGMPNARLKVTILPKTPDQYGADDVQFLFDANKSNRFEPIRKVASGGELSRLMLSIKSLVAESMDMPTLIFDEIDTGISGEAARQVGIIMQTLAKQRQLITITHQPQIAGKADAHLFVYKEIRGKAVRTGIRHLDREERITAIAQMLSGEKPTAAAMQNAREMVMN